MNISVGFLRKWSLTYLLLPNALFAVGWLRQPYSTMLILGYCFLLYFEIRRSDETIKISLSEIGFLLFTASCWTFFSGIHGFSRQSFDWPAHNAKLFDLFKNQWPIYFPEVDRFATYYFGYYIVPAFISKLFGQLLPSVFILWTLLGFFLSVAWVFILLNKRRILLILFLTIRGAGLLWSSIVDHLNVMPKATLIFWPSIRSVFEQSTFVPNQVIPAVIGSCILLYNFIYRKNIDHSFFVITLIFFWAVFPAISLLVLFLALFIHKYIFINSRQDLVWRDLLYAYIVPGILFIPIFIYFSSSTRIADQGFIWNFDSLKSTIASYVIKTLIDFTIFYVIAIYANNRTNFLPNWLVNVLFILLFLLSIYKIGIYHDSFFRGSIPLSVILFICLLRGLDNIEWVSRWSPDRSLYFSAAALMVFVILFIRTPRLHDNILTEYIVGKTRSYTNKPYDAYVNSYQALHRGYNDEAGARQYLAAKESWFGKYFRRGRIER